MVEAISQSEYIKRQIARHQNNSPTLIYDAINHIIKGAQKIMHSISLVQAEIADLQETNHLLNRRHRAKKDVYEKGKQLL